MRLAGLLCIVALALAGPASQAQGPVPPGTLTIAIPLKDGGAGVPGLPLRVLRVNDPDSGYGGNSVTTDAQGRAVYRVNETGLYRVDVEPAGAGLFAEDKPLAAFAEYYLPMELGAVPVRAGE